MEAMHICTAGSCDGITDEELVISTLKEKDCFVCIIDRYEAPLSRYILRITNVSIDDSKDLLQDVFIRIYTNLNGFDTDLKFSSWAYRIAHNQVISSYRKKNVRPEGHLIKLEDGKLESFMSDIDIVEDVHNKDMRKEIDGVLDTMDIKYREVLILKFFEDKDYQEISDIVRKPLGTIATLIHRAKKLFKEKYTISNG